MVCTRPDLSQAVSMVSRYMHDLGQDHWEAVKWIMRYIKGTIDVGLVFEKDSTGKQDCIGYIDSDYAGDLDKRRSTMGMFLHYLKHRLVVLYSTVYRRIVYYRR